MIHEKVTLNMVENERHVTILACAHRNYNPPRLSAWGEVSRDTGSYSVGFMFSIEQAKQMVKRIQDELDLIEELKQEED